jgi:hypothetical protein
MSSCCDHRGCVLLVVGWRRRVKCVCSFLHVRTHLKQNKFLHLLKSCCHNEEDVTYGIRAGLTHDLVFATAYVDMIRFNYTVADRVDCVHVGNHG